MQGMLIGALIGYFTNMIAIKMLFWPHTKWTVAGFGVPLTPGLFVKKKGEFAGAVGDLIEERFVTPEMAKKLSQAFLGNDSMSAIKKTAGAVIDDGDRPAVAAAKMAGVLMAFSGNGGITEKLMRMAVGIRRDKIISRLVLEHISEMSVEEIEDMVMTVVASELKAITWFGAVLGAGIGVWA